MTKTLIIIGAGAEQVPAYERAKARGLYVVGTDMNPQAPGFAVADDALIASTRDAKQTLDVVWAYHQKHPVDGVITIANDVPYTVAYVAQALGLRSISLDAARCASHKLLMKERFAQHGVACPWFCAMPSLDALETLLAGHPGERFVLKPVDGRGARGVLVLTSQSNLAWAFQESTRWGDSGQLMIERFIPGMQLSTESFILNGRCYTPAISERNYARMDEFLPYVIEDGGTIPAPLSEEQKQAIDDLILRGAKAMGIDHGIVKGDLVIAPDGTPMIIELAARLSGGWFATHQILQASGVDLVNAVIADALGEPVTPQMLMPTCQRATAIRYWFPPPGRITGIDGEDRLRQISGLMAYGFFRQVGEEQPPIHSHPDRFGYVMVSAGTRDEAVYQVEKAVASLQVSVQTGKTVA